MKPTIHRRHRAYCKICDTPLSRENKRNKNTTGMCRNCLNNHDLRPKCKGVNKRTGEPCRQRASMELEWIDDRNAVGWCGVHFKMKEGTFVPNKLRNFPNGRTWSRKK